MIDKIVTLLDGSILSQCVLPHTRAVAQAFQANVTLLQVLEPKKVKTDTGRLDPVNWHLQKLAAQSFLNTVSQEQAHETVTYDTLLLEGAPASRIIEHIEETHPDLIMLSSHGQGGLSAWNVSSMAQKIIDRAFCSFMLVRAYQQQKQDESTERVHYRRIVVPLDGSKRAEYVLPIASTLAIAHGAELWLVHAQGQPNVIQSHTLTPEETAVIEQLKERNQRRAQHYLTQTAEQMQARASIHNLSGSSPADLLLEFVDANEVDLVVMSAHGYSCETIRPYGSIVSSFISYGSTPLLILQDLTQNQIKPTKAELSAAAAGHTGRRNRKNAYAQPENWSSTKSNNTLRPIEG